MSITIEEAKARLAEKFGDSTRLGGKGVPRRKVGIIYFYFWDFHYIFYNFYILIYKNEIYCYLSLLVFQDLRVKII